MAFATLCLSRLFHGFNCKSGRPVLFTRAFWNNKFLLGAFAVGALLLAAVLLLLRKHRWTGMSLSFALILDLICCNIVLKPLVGRIRPFLVNTAVELLTAPPADASFPSGHTAASFAAVFALRASGSPLWKPALVLAAGIAFSRLYLYVHWPTDVLGGILVGAAAGWAGARLADALRRRRERLGRRA